MKHISIRISGIVQGVFFRASTKETADRLNIHGFVRNEPDGSVYVEAEGDEQQLRQFTEWCSRGPARANVEKIEITEGPLKNYSGFIIERGE